MKLLIIFTSRDDAKKLTEQFRQKHLTLTVIGSQGGFLRRKNATLLTALPDERLEETISLIRETCPPRTEQVDTSFAAGGFENIGLPDATEVPVGGATILILNTEKIIKI